MESEPSPELPHKLGCLTHCPTLSVLLVCVLTRVKKGSVLPGGNHSEEHRTGTQGWFSFFFFATLASSSWFFEDCQDGETGPCLQKPGLRNAFGVSTT